MDQLLRSKGNIEQRDIFDLFPDASTFIKTNWKITLNEAVGVVRGYRESHNCTF